MNISRRVLILAAVLLAVAGILAAVGGPAAVASYHHAYEVAKRFGESPDRATWLPLTTDGMLLAALVVMYWRRWQGERVGVVPWLAFITGGCATAAANLASADIANAPTTGEAAGRLAVALWAPVAFGVTLELVAVMLGFVRNWQLRVSTPAPTLPPMWLLALAVRAADSDRAAAAERTAAAERAAAADRLTAALLAAGPPPVRPARPRTGPDRSDRTGPEPTGPDRRNGTVRWTEQDEAVRMDLQTETQQTGSLPTVRAIRDRYKMGADRARKIHDRLTEPEPRTVPADGGADS